MKATCVTRRIRNVWRLWSVLSLSHPFFLSFTRFLIYFAFNKLHWLTWQQATNSRWLHVLAASPLNVFHCCCCCCRWRKWRMTLSCHLHAPSLLFKHRFYCVLPSGHSRCHSHQRSWTWSRSGHRQVPSEHGSKPLANVASVARVQTSSALCCCHSQRSSDF